MPYTTLITPEELSRHLDDPSWAIVDCRFSLQDPEAGRQAYQEAHIPGAVYAHLDEDLSGPVVPGRTGRHPLPRVEAFTQRLGQWGIHNRTQVVAYDQAGGALAARLWWMLRWLGHEAVAVLDGGWSAWTAEGLPVRSGEESRPEVRFTPRIRPEMAVDTATVDRWRRDPAYRVVDSRSPERYRGEQETIDPVAGHIPGAVNLYYGENLTGGRFLDPATLRARFQALLGSCPPEQVVFYCGSGVTACHNILAMVHAGMGQPRLYPGSWSEWIADPSRPVATGPE